MAEEANEKSKWLSRKLIVVLFFGIVYPLMVAGGISIPPESMYIIIAYLLGQSSVDLLKEWLPKAGRTGGQGATGEQS